MKKYLKPIFSKKILGFVFMFIQLMFIGFTITGIYEASFLLYGSLTALSVIIIILEINREVDSAVKIIWIAIVAVIPVFGVFLYVYVHSDGILKIYKRRLESITAKISRFTSHVSEDYSELKEVSPVEFGMFNYLKSVGNAPCFSAGDIKYFPTGENMFESLVADVKQARKYIFVEMFIINEKDYMWQEFLRILEMKVREGVEVRLMYDGMGSFSTTKREFAERMRQKGIKCYTFAPVRPFVSTYHNNRDHRKIVIIDGKYAYTGGVNLADEYINRKKRYGHWKDTAIRASGQSVKGFLLMYFKIWGLCSNTGDDYMQYLVCTKENLANQGYITAFDDVPMDEEPITKNVFLHIINSAREYVYINTPYLVLGDDLISALKFAAGRGVDVRLCCPRIPDKWYAFAVARTYYPELIKAGVRIYEYTPGFLHAKSTFSDDKRAYIGSANYDFRSLYHNYEGGAYIYDNPVIADIKDDFCKTVNKSHMFTLQDYKKLNIFYRIIARVLKLFSPLL